MPAYETNHNNLNNLINLRLAVLIDAENVPRNCIKSVMEEIAIYGTPTIKRIYGDWTSQTVSGWKSSLLENAITPIQQYSYTVGKNSSDSAMIIDAMDILYSDKTDGFVIVSSDSDFTRLAIRLREAGQRVIGIGERKTPTAFIAACDKFTYIEVIRERAAATSIRAAYGIADEAGGTADDTNWQKPHHGQGHDKYPESGHDLRGDPHDDHLPDPSHDPHDDHHDSHHEHGGDSKRHRNGHVPDYVVHLIADSVADLAGDSGAVFMGELGNLLLKKQPAFDHRNYGFKSLSALIKSLERFEIDFRQTTDPNIKHVFVRDKEA